MDERALDALGDMLDHAHELTNLASGEDVEDVLADRVRCLAVERLLEIVGEAAGRVPGHVRAKIDIPWREIVGLRNRLIPAYHRTDPATLTWIITDEVPRLVHALEAYLERS